MKIRSFQGFGLVETIVAVGLFAVLLVTGITTILHSYSINRLSDEETEAVLFAQQGVEAARSIRNQSWHVFVNSECSLGCGLETSLNYYKFSGLSDDLGKYTRKTFITDVQRDSSGQVVESGGTIDNSIKKITSQVDWDFSPTRHKSVSLSAYVTFFEKIVAGVCTTSHWPFDEDEGSLASDVEGNNDGAINEANWSLGILASALEFDGENDRVVVTDSDSLDLTSSGTIAAWVRADSHQPFAGIVHKGHQKDWSDEVYSLQFWDTDGTLTFALRNNFGVYDRLTSSTKLQTATWYHVAATWDMDKIKLYINGAEDSSRDNTIGFPRVSDGNLIIGAQIDEYYDSNWQYLSFDGKIDDVRLFCSALSADDIKSLYEMGN